MCMSCMYTCSEVPYDTNLLARYRKALDTSVKIATVHNVPPIRGTTIIYVNLSCSMNRPCTSAKGLGKPRQVSIYRKVIHPMAQIYLFFIPFVYKILQGTGLGNILYHSLSKLNELDISSIY